jgi:acyl carrier protein
MRYPIPTSLRDLPCERPDFTSSGLTLYVDGTKRGRARMEEPEVERRCIEIIARSKLLPLEAVTRDKTFDELSMDSLDKINISFEVEEVFAITIPDESLSSLRTVGDVIDGVLRLRQPSHPEPLPAP